MRLSMKLRHDTSKDAFICFTDAWIIEFCELQRGGAGDGNMCL